jgi:serine/threonine protein kinase
MRGGKLVGQGSYGCGFIPAIQCAEDAERPENTFTKLMTIKDAKIELSMAKHIERIDPSQKYSVYARILCEPNVNALMSESTIFKCNILRKLNPRSEGNMKYLLSSGEFALLQTPNGGEELQSLRLSKNKFIDLLVSLQNLFKGLYKFHKEGIYHLDIKGDNILVSEKDGKFLPRFIDFGLSRTAEELINDKEYPMDMPYFVWPYEFHLYKNYKYIASMGPSMMMAKMTLYNKNPMLEIEQTYLQKYPINSDGPFYMPSGVYFNEGKHSYDNDYYKDMMRNIFVKLKNDGIDALKKYLEKVDVYGLGQCLAVIFYQNTSYAYKFNKVIQVNSRSETVVTDPNVIEYVEAFYNLIKGMMHPNPDERYDVRQSLYAYQEFLGILQTTRLGSITEADYIDVISPFENELVRFSSNPRTLNESIVKTVHKGFISSQNEAENSNNSLNKLLKEINLEIKK